MQFYGLSGLSNVEDGKAIFLIPIFTDGKKFYRQREVGFCLDVLCYHLSLLTNLEMRKKEIEAYYSESSSLVDRRVKYIKNDQSYPLEVIAYDIQSLIRYKNGEETVVQEPLLVSEQRNIMGIRVNGFNYVGDVDFLLEQLKSITLDSTLEIYEMFYILHSCKRDYQECLKICEEAVKISGKESEIWDRRLMETTLLREIDGVCSKEKEEKKYGIFRKKGRD